MSSRAGNDDHSVITPEQSDIWWRDCTLSWHRPHRDSKRLVSTGKTSLIVEAWLPGCCPRLLHPHTILETGWSVNVSLPPSHMPNLGRLGPGEALVALSAHSHVILVVVGTGGEDILAVVQLGLEGDLGNQHVFTRGPVGDHRVEQAARLNLCVDLQYGEAG